MTEYNKETVATLRGLLKDRGIPSTGLTRKAQIVEKLEEWDGREGGGKAEEEGEGTTVGGTPEVTAGAVNAPVSEKETPVEESKAEETAEVTANAPEHKDETPAEATPEGTANTPVPEETTGPEVQEDGIAASAPKDDSQPSAEAADQAQLASESNATDFACTNKTPSPSPDEKQSIEKPELVPNPERSSTTTADPSRLNTEELEADTRKRKRRSQTPEISTQEVRAKKPRPSDDAVREDAPAQDEDTVMEQRAPEEAEKELDEKAMEQEAINGHQQAEPNEPDAPADEDVQAPKDTVREPESRPQTEKKDRYREAFKPASSSTPADAPPDLYEDHRAVSPALHPATPALYIRNLMRPLRPEPLRAHLVSLASPPGADPDPDMLTALFLDNMKTHALVRFASTTAAARVRAAMHGTIWPPEANRKDLWVDFIPDASCQVWITQEEDAMAAEKEARAAGRPIAAKKFEVVYEPSSSDADDRDGVSTYTAIFQEVGASAAPFNPPKAPRNHVPPAPAPIPAPIRHSAEQSFKTLDELFSSTAAKPKLYFLPVSDVRAEARLKELAQETSRDWAPGEKRKGRGMRAVTRLDQKVRFTFGEVDSVVEAGGDFGPWSESGGGGGFRGRGGWRGRGRGGGWRS
ncbi:hypothetical protein BU23DRAFT_508527, partial [Bimuria novae-zelandiae CBS 107.79]